MARKVKLSPHNPKWVQQYETEAVRLTAIFRPNVAAACSQLKERLAQQYVSELKLYTNSKTAFVQNIGKKAYSWRKKQVAT